MNKVNESCAFSTLIHLYVVFLQIKECRLYENINSISIYVCAERSEAQQAMIEVKGACG